MQNPNEAGSADAAAAGLVIAPALEGEVMFAPRGRFDFECYDAAGNLKWRDGFDNVVCKDGKILALDVLFGATAKPSWFIVLKGGALGGTAALDTMASHAGWTEYQAYVSATRPAVTFNAAAVASTTGASITHTQIGFTINGGGGQVSGAGACTNSTKGGSTGTLYNVGDFSAARTVADGDVLNVTLSLTLAA